MSNYNPYTGEERGRSPYHDDRHMSKSSSERALTQYYDNLEVSVTPHNCMYLDDPILRKKVANFFAANLHKREVRIHMTERDYAYFRRAEKEERNREMDWQLERMGDPFLGMPATGIHAWMNNVINDDLPKDAEIVKIKIQKEVKINTNLIEL